MSYLDYRYVTTQLYQSGSTPNPIIGEFPFTRVNFTQQLSSIGVFTGEVLLSGLSGSQLNFDAATIPGKNALYVFHGNTPIWSGVITAREYDSSTQIAKITAREMTTYFEHRRISGFTSSSYYNANAGGTGVGGLVYGNSNTGVGVDPLVVMKDLLLGANAKAFGDIGVRYASSNPTTVSGGSTIIRSFFDFELKTVYQAWKDLAQGSTYFDFVIKPRLASNGIVNEIIVGTPTLGVNYSASSTTSTNLHFPGNIVSYTIAEDATKIGNYLYGIGYGANQNRIISKYYDNGKLTSGGSWALLEDAVNFIDIVTPALLATVTQGKLAAVSYPPTIVQVVMPSFIDPIYNQNVSGYYSIGDQANVIIADDRFVTSVNGIYRIIGIDVEPGDSGPDRITLTLNLPLATTLVAD